MPPGLFATLARVLAGPGSKQPDPNTSSPKEQPPFGGAPGIGAVVASRYRLDAELGRGGAGVVYRAHDLVNDREVAVKVLSLGANAIAREQFSREATLSGQLSHPHIIGVYETGFVESDNPRSAPFIAMELNRGTSLDRLQNLSYSQIINIAAQICEALEYAHARGLVHRDLKPQNILVEKRGFAYTVKLADFGLARANNERENVAAGTVYYIAPEVIAGQPATVAADLYSLGVVLYEMVTGRVPFSNYDEESILAQHLNEQVVPPGRTRVDVPPDLEAIILRLLAKNPEERFASARVLREALEQIALSPGAPLQGNLPETPQDNSGRELEAESVKHLLEDKRIVSVTGTEEEERTRLVLAVGAELKNQFRDGVWLIALGETADPVSVPQLIANALHVHPEADRNLVVTLGEFLSERNALLILDHCSNLSGACAQFAQAVLQRCPEVCLLVASDRPLGIANESVFSIPSRAPSDKAE